MLSPPSTWTGTVVPIGPDEYSRVRFYGGDGLYLPDRRHTCNDNTRIETVHLSADAGFAYWCHVNSGTPQLYLRRGDNPDWAWCSVSQYADNEWTESYNVLTGAPNHFWSLLVYSWHYRYVGGSWVYQGPKTMTGIQLFGGVQTSASDYCNHDGNSELCGPSGEDRAWVPFKVQVAMLAPLGGPPPFLYPEWSYEISHSAVEYCAAYQAVT